MKCQSWKLKEAKVKAILKLPKKYMKYVQNLTLTWLFFSIFNKYIILYDILFSIICRNLYFVSVSYAQYCISKLIL
jgi:hypothetical protein